jgi:hypothetical protein
VAYGRRLAHRLKFFSGAQSGRSPGTDSGPETAKYPATQTGLTGSGTHSGPTIDISGGGGLAGGVDALEAKATSARGAAAVPPSAAWTTPVLTEFCIELFRTATIPAPETDTPVSTGWGRANGRVARTEEGEQNP